MLYIQCNSTDPITHDICYFWLHFLLLNDITFCIKLFTAARVWKNAFVCFHHILNWPIGIKFLRPMSGHLVWQLLKAWSWRTVKLNTILQCILLYQWLFEINCHRASRLSGLSGLVYILQFNVLQIIIHIYWYSFLYPLNLFFFKPACLLYMYMVCRRSTVTYWCYYPYIF